MLKKTLIALTLPLVSILAITVATPCGAFQRNPHLRRRAAPWQQPRRLARFKR